MFRRLTVLAAGIILSSATPAMAQMQWTDKGFLNLSGGVGVGSSDVTSTTTFALYDEEATLVSAQDVKGGFFVDLHGGYRIRRNLAVGASVTFLQSKADAAIAGSIPDPIAFDAHRAAGATASDLVHRETWVAGLLTWALPLTDKIDVFVSGGPAWVQVEQEIPTAVTVTEPNPTISDVQVTSFKKGGIGFTVGGDVRYMLTQKLGLGVMARFSAASVELTDNTKVDAGGFQVGGGIRYRF